MRDLQPSTGPTGTPVKRRSMNLGDARSRPGAGRATATAKTEWPEGKNGRDTAKGNGQPPSLEGGGVLQI